MLVGCACRGLIFVLNGMCCHAPMMEDSMLQMFLSNTSRHTHASGVSESKFVRLLPGTGMLLGLVMMYECTTGKPTHFRVNLGLPRLSREPTMANGVGDCVQ